jgi:hypothetical protein
VQRSLEDVLGPFRAESLTSRLCGALFQNLPGAPPFVFYNDLRGALVRVHGEAADGLAARAASLAGSEPTRRALAVADALDTADAGLAVAAGIGNLFSLFGGASKKRRVFESDSQQAIDAALKLLALAYMTHQLFPGTPQQKLAALAGLPAGREALIYSALAEVALPFADNVVEGGTGLVSQIVRGASGAGADRLGGFVGATGLGEARTMLGAMSGTLESTLRSVGGQIGPVTSRLRAFVPTALGAADSVAGVVASGLDAMPVWRFIGGRLAAEACASRAASEA